MATSVFVFFLTVCILTVSVQSVSVADSQYPIYKANRERNNQINGSILCSDVAPGRTTVLNDTWASTDTRQADTVPPIIGQNYFYILVSSSGSNYVIRQYAIAGKSPFIGEYPFRAMPTILQDGNLVVSSASDTVLLNQDLGELIVPLTNFDSQIGEQIIIPYQSSLLLRPDTSDSAGLISALNLTNDISNAYWTSNLTCPGTIRNIMVYSPLPGVDILVVVADAGTWDTPKNITICVDTATYLIDGRQMSDWVDPFIVADTVYITLDNETIARFNIDSRTFGSAIIWNDLYYTQKSIMARGSKALASLKSDFGNIIVELVSNTVVLADKYFAGHPTFSIPDNVVVFPTLDDEGNQQLMALDWDTWEVKATGLFDQLSIGTEMSEAVFDENCNVFVTTGDGIVHKFVPLPISDVVPMLDCIDEFNVAYFSYKNNEQDGLRIPYVTDRNALTPDNIAPITLFNLDDVVHYPFSTRVQLQNASATYQWRLEDYLLTFSITPQLACPRNVSLTLTFIAMDKFNETSFTNVVINALVVVTGVRVERVSVVNVTTQNNVAKRMIRQGAPTLELELEIGAGNSSEPTSAEIVKDLVNNQSDELANQVASDPDAPAQTQLNGIVPKAPVNAQSGELTPIVPPVASPNKSPTSGPSTPQQQQPSTSAPTSTPVQATSSGSKIVLLRSVLCMLVALVMSY